MTETERALIFVVITNFPLVAGFLFSLNRQWLVTGISHRAQMAGKDEQIRIKDQELVFREQLRQEALEDRRAIEARSLTLANAQKELTDVVRQTLDFNERLIDERDEHWDGTNRRRRPATRSRARVNSRNPESS